MAAQVLESCRYPCQLLLLLLLLLLLSLLLTLAA
jgi:hypothetical protein